MTLLAILVLTLLFGFLGWLLAIAQRHFKLSKDPLTEDINALLPQIQCGQCGFPGCRPYAEAIAHGAADINQCPPGGAETITLLAEFLGREAKPQDPHYGLQKPPLVAVIDEPRCIGCALCLSACPVDAILGAAKFMHTVIASECTGCELCIPSCPVDCIDLLSPDTAAAPLDPRRGR